MWRKQQHIELLATTFLLNNGLLINPWSVHGSRFHHPLITCIPGAGLPGIPCTKPESRFARQLRSSLEESELQLFIAVSLPLLPSSLKKSIPTSKDSYCMHGLCPSSVSWTLPHIWCSQYTWWHIGIAARLDDLVRRNSSIALQGIMSVT